MKKFFDSWFNRFFILYLLSYALPAVWFGGVVSSGSNELIWGWGCAMMAFVYMFMIPLVFLGNISNLIVLVVLILHWTKSIWLKRRSQVVKFLLLTAMVISLFSWMSWIGDLYVGYYLWVISCIGMLAAHLFKDLPEEEETEMDMLEHLIE